MKMTDIQFITIFLTGMVYGMVNMLVTFAWGKRILDELKRH